MNWRVKLRDVLSSDSAQITLAALVAGLFVFFLVDRMIMPLYTRQGSEHPVPQLLGLNRVEAVRRADSAGFLVLEENSKLAGRVAEGTILEQRPSAGALAKPGRKIHVVPAAAAARDLTPDMIGLDLRDAQLRCKNAGLVSGDAEVRYRFSSQMPKGRIVDQEPAAGKPVEPGAAVRLTVSMGIEPEEFYVPVLIDHPLSEALVILRESGLKLGKIVRKETMLYDPSTVIGQSIKSGEAVERGTSIDLVVAIQGNAE
ncbi:PASTA domain-containing protein [candidate division KSB1 bacterium]|nr:PASTA domain-containing protein [candidate division KSB1 bacterium]